MDQARETTVRRRPKCHALERPGPVTGGVKHLPSGQHQLDRPPHLPRRNRSECHMGPSPEARAESAADEGADHPHVFGRNPEDGGHLRLLVHNELALAPQRQAITIPRSDRCMRLHRIVVLARYVVGRVDLHRCAHDSGIGVAARLVGLRA
jgi:hypothetical protein